MEKIMNGNSTETSRIWNFKGQEDFIDDWFLMSSPGPVALISLAYLLFVLKLGPSSMKNRSPFKLNNVLILYNFLQVLASVYIFSYGTRILLVKGLSYKTCDLEKNEVLDVANGMYLYFAAKLSELLDTVFFVLRKKNNQVTFLHCYHHFIMLHLSWYTLKYEPTYTTVFLGTVNSFVHVVMYTYYALSAFPNIAKYLWWKKYITSLQLFQFLIVIIQNVVNYVWSGCKPSYFMMTMIMFNGLFFIYLFGDFYVRSYIKNRNDKEKHVKAVSYFMNDSRKMINDQSKKLVEKCM